MLQGTTVVGPLVSVVLVLAGSVLGVVARDSCAVSQGNPTNGSSSTLGTHLEVIGTGFGLGALRLHVVGIPVGVVSEREGARARRMQHDLVAARPGKREGWETRFLWRGDDLLSFVPSAAN